MQTSRPSSASSSAGTTLAASAGAARARALAESRRGASADDMRAGGAHSGTELPAAPPLQRRVSYYVYSGSKSTHSPVLPSIDLTRALQAPRCRRSLTHPVAVEYGQVSAALLVRKESVPAVRRQGRYDTESAESEAGQRYDTPHGGWQTLTRDTAPSARHWARSR